MANSEGKHNTPPGPAVDASGQAVIDPTENVRELVAAEVKRLDDLRAAETKLQQAEIRHLKDVVRMERVHSKEMRKVETKRLNAIRSVDVNSSAVERTAAENRAATLAKQVTDSADALRAQVQQTADVAATSLRTELVPIKDDISKLRDEFNKQQGERAQVSESKSDTREVGASRGMWIGVAIAAAGFVVSFIVAAVVIIGILASRGGTP